MTIRDARGVIGSGMGIIGGIEPTTFLNLPEVQLDPCVRSVIQDAAGGPFVLANSDSCPPGVTVSKFERVDEDGFERNSPPWVNTVNSLWPDFPVFGSIIEVNECLTRLIGPENHLLWLGNTTSRG
jgi:hypothetical protein